MSAVASAAPAPPVLQQPLTVPEPVPSVVPVDLQMTQAQPPGPDLSVTPRAQAPALSQEPAVQETPRHGAVQIILNGSPVLLPGKPDGTPNLFFDVLNYVEIDPDHPQGEPVIRRNERAASYIEPIHDGDRIEVYWG